MIRKTLILIGLLTLLSGAALIAVSPQTTPGIHGKDGSAVAEIIDVRINGVMQRLLIRGENTDNPLLLHVHGGPGGPDQPTLLAKHFDIEDLFTVVYWDQRGAGASYSADDDPADLSLAQIVDDGIQLSEYLLQRFAKERLFLQGHSWGTLVATHMATLRPELYEAYFGIGHIANSRQAERLSYDYTVEQAKLAGDEKTLNTLLKLGPPPYATPEEWKNAVAIQRSLMQPYEKPGEPVFMSMPEIYLTFTLYQGYSIADKLNALKGTAVSIDRLWMEAIDADLITTHRNFQIPVYFFQGSYDQHTVTAVAKAYFDVIEAPRKEYFEFSKSAHWPHIEEFARYRSLVERLSR